MILKSESGCSFNKQRHIAKHFGPDVTEKILGKYGISLLIRSHECKDEGYAFHHSNKCITIFSASNYCGGINKGSICVIRPKQKLEIKQFIAPGCGDNDLERIKLFEQKAIRGLKRLIYTNRNVIREEFKKLDPKNSGYIRCGGFIFLLVVCYRKKIKCYLLNKHRIMKLLNIKKIHS